jgi:mannan endo-1,4-beta-mannosidase
MKALLRLASCVLACTCCRLVSAQATRPAIVEELHATAPTTRRFVSSQPNVPYLPKPATQPVDWIVEHEPVTSNASPEARALLKFLYSISGKHTIIGQHNYPAQQEIFTKAASGEFGKTPALYGTDWGFAAAGDKDSAYIRREIVQELIKQHRRGSIIALCWHQVRPTDDEPVTFRGSVQQHLTDAQWDDLLTPGSPLNKHWAAQVDVIAEYLKQLQDAHVPVLWRPYHEINGAWFWWNGRRGEHGGTRALYRQLFDRLVNFHKLTNLIWVWNPDQPSTPDRQFVDYFPGHDVVDVLALDDYGPFQQSYYDDLNALSDGKVMAISECGNNFPTLDVYRTQPKWAYVMRWSFEPSRTPATRPATSRPSRAPLATDPALFPVIAKDPRMFSLEDQAYWQAIAPLRVAAGLPPTANP